MSEIRTPDPQARSGFPPEAARSAIALPPLRPPEPAALVREPLLDASENLVGYELKLDTAFAPGGDINARVLAQLALLDLGALSSHRLIVLALDAAELLRANLHQLPRDKLILAVRLPPTMTPALVTGLKHAWAQGFCVALDGYAFSPEQRHLLDAVSYVRIDVSRHNGLELARHSATLLDDGGVRLIASQVRSRDEFDACRKLPFDYYQGAFFTGPPARPEARIDQPRAQVIELLNLVRQKAELSAIEKLLRRDPTLAYRLLRYINSPAVGLEREIRSIAHALVLLGYQPLYRWLTLLLFASGPDAPRKRALLTHALVRGRLMELVGRAKLPAAEADSLFVVGIFSVLDSLLGIPLRQALAAIRLGEPMMAALLDRSGLYAPYLQLALACEGDGRERVQDLARECGTTAEAVNAAHFDALMWAESLE